MDAICQVASNEQTRPMLFQLEAVPKLVCMLPTPNCEVQVRALMGLGMLVGSDEQRLAALAAVPGAITSILGLMQRSSDQDCKVIARDLCMLLARQPEVKQQIEEALRSSAN